MQFSLAPYLFLISLVIVFVKSDNICDLNSGNGWLKNFSIVLCKRSVPRLQDATFVCPQRVGNEEYYIYPPGGGSEAVVYRSPNQTYSREVALYEVVNVKAVLGWLNGDLFTLERKGGSEILHFTYPKNALLVYHHQPVLLFMCIPRSIVLDKEFWDTMFREINIDIRPFPDDYFTRNIQGFKSVGIVEYHFDDLFKVTHGTSNRPNDLFTNTQSFLELDLVSGDNMPLFYPNNEMAAKMFEEISKYERGESELGKAIISYTSLDVMQHYSIGFYCDGIIRPDSCFKKLLNEENLSILIVSDLAISSWNALDEGRFVHVKYNPFMLPHRFSGVCQCIGRNSGKVNAIIKIDRPTEHICNITNKVFKNKISPIRGEWCRFILHGGDSVKIIYPDDEGSQGGEPTGVVTAGKASDHNVEEPPAYPFHSRLFPINFTESFYHRSRVNRRSYFLEKEIRSVITGNAYQVEKIGRGEVVIRYRRGLPLSFFGDCEPINYQWTLKNRYGSGVGDVEAKIQIMLARTHEYTVGCESTPNGTFIMDNRPLQCNNIFGDCIGNEFRHCQYYFTNQFYTAGIFCNPGETLHPRDCRSFLYNHKRNAEQSLPFPYVESNQTALKKLRVFFVDSDTSNAKFSMSCSCVDRKGREMARLVLHLSRIVTLHPRSLYSRLSDTADSDHILIIPKVVVTSDGDDGVIADLRCATVIHLNVIGKIPEVRNIPLVYKPKDVLYVVESGMSLCLISRAPGSYRVSTILPLSIFSAPTLVNHIYSLEGLPKHFEIIGQESYDDPSLSHQRFFPSNFHTHHYVLAYENGNPKLPYLKLRSHSSVIGTNIDGLKIHVSKLQNFMLPDYSRIVIAQPKSAIIVIKEPGVSDVSFIFACGAIAPKSPARSGRLTTRTPNVMIEREDNSMGGIIVEGEEPLTQDDVRSMEVWSVYRVVIKATDPYVKGCGVTEDSEEIFRSDTETVKDKDGRITGCTIDLTRDKVAGFYCPLPHYLDPQGCFHNVFVPETTRTVPLILLSDRIKYSKSEHFHLLNLDANTCFQSLMKPLRRVQPFECYCKRLDGSVASTIRIAAY